MRTMSSRAALVALAIACAVAPAGTATASGGPAIVPEDGWARWVPPPVPTSALYGVLKNRSDRPLVLTGCSTTSAERCVPMTTRREETGSPAGPVMRMVAVRRLAILPRGRLALEPGGDHLMLVGLHAPLVRGDGVDVTLRFEDGSAVTVRAGVARR